MAVVQDGPSAFPEHGGEALAGARVRPRWMPTPRPRQTRKEQVVTASALAGRSGLGRDGDKALIDQPREKDTGVVLQALRRFVREKLLQGMCHGPG